jgi:DNA-binding phage protein
MWYDNLYHLISLRGLMKSKQLSERALAQSSQISRLTLRSALLPHQDARISTWAKIAKSLDRQIYLVAEHAQTIAECSAQASGYQVLRDGPDSWKIHYMNFVDEFRRTLDGRLILLPPPKELEVPLKALLSSIVCYLCHEVEMAIPDWAQKRFVLSEPWFPSESESLKALMIRETPIEFRKNQIFVGENFLRRA